MSALAPAPRPFAPAFEFRDQGHRAVEPDGQNLLGVDLGVFAFVLQIGAVAAEARADRLAALGVNADLARQRQKLERVFEVTDASSTPARERGALGLVAVIAFAKLDIGTEAPVLEVDGQARFGVVAEHRVGGRGC